MTTPWFMLYNNKLYTSRLYGRGELTVRFVRAAARFCSARRFPVSILELPALKYKYSVTPIKRGVIKEEYKA